MRSRDGLAGILLCLLVPEGAIGLGGTADAGPNSRTSAPLGPECYLSAPVDGNPDAAAAAFRDLGSILLYAGTLLRTRNFQWPTSSVMVMPWKQALSKMNTIQRGNHSTNIFGKTKI
jgi:hypothetical protein